MRTYAILVISSSMNIRPISEWTLYRFRFGLSYLLLAVLVGLFIGLQSDLMPPGMGPSEKQSVIHSTSLDLTKFPTEVVDLPFHLAQMGSLQLFGVTPLGVRLPTLVIGGFTAIFIALILRRWFKPNVAIVAALVVLSSSWFISTARLGAPFIMVPFWTSLVLLAATYVAQETENWKLWRVTLAFTGALSLYTPFMIYLFVAAFIASFSQPHLRYLVRRSSKFGITLGTMLFLALLLPLAWGIYNHWEQIWQLLAIPQQLPGPVQFGNSLVDAASSLVNPYNVSFTESLTPLLSLASTALLLMGGARLLRDAHSVRAYVLLMWGAILIPIVAFNPGNLVFLLVPSMLVIAIGVHLTINYWYRLFPRNPYARVFGLLPLAVLVLAIVSFNNQRYTYGMLYSQQAAAVFNSDAFLAQKELKAIPDGANVTMVVPEGDEPLYRLVAKQHPNTMVINAAQVNLTSGTWIIAEGEILKVATLPGPVPSRLIVNDHKEDSLRFRVYQR